MLHLLAERVEHAQRGTSGGVVIAWVIGLAVLAVLGRFVTHSLDRSRIAKYAQQQGWELIDCRWKLLGPGWFGNSRERIYSITYRDGQGQTRSAFAKTSALAGVYLTQDQVQG